MSKFIGPVACLETLRILAEGGGSLAIMHSSEGNLYRWAALSAPLSVAWPLVVASMMVMFVMPPTNPRILVPIGVLHSFFSAYPLIFRPDGVGTGTDIFCVFNFLVSIIVIWASVSAGGSHDDDDPATTETTIVSVELLRIAVELVVTVQIISLTEGAVSTWAIAATAMSIGFPILFGILLGSMLCLRFGSKKISDKACMHVASVLTCLLHIAFYVYPVWVGAPAGVVVLSVFSILCSLGIMSAIASVVRGLPE